MSTHTKNLSEPWFSLVQLGIKKGTLNDDESSTRDIAKNAKTQTNEDGSSFN